MRQYTKQEIDEALIIRHTASIHQRLSTGNVAVAGLGGLGSNIAVMLARMGVGYLHLIDYDNVELLNLNRQQYFMEQVGMKKTEALRQQIQKINPFIKVKTDCCKVTEENLYHLFYDNEIICEAFDKPEQKAMLVNKIRELFPEKTVVAASGMSGYGSSNRIITQRVMNRLYLCGDGGPETNGHGNLMAPRVHLCAAHQANMIIRLLLGESTA